ncbi:MAG: nuclear transport factor 2 family protein [Pseudomonadales bacterium]
MMLTSADYIAIQNLIHSYPKQLDSGDLEGLGQLFACADVYFEGREEPVRKDPAAISAMFRDFLQLYEGKPRTRHIIANLILEEDASGGAVASSTVVVFQQTEALPLQPIITGDYHDRFARIDGQWQFVERRISNDLYGDLSAHGRYDIAP